MTIHQGFKLNNSLVLIWPNEEKAQILLASCSLHFSVYLVSNVFWKKLTRELFSHKSLKIVLRQRNKAYKVEVLEIFSSLKESSIYY